jgi:RAQPRD family integrative conjugative element protein
MPSQLDIRRGPNRHPLRLASICVAMLAGIGATTARADEDAEREHLARISYELQRLQQEVTDAQRNADENGRVRFRYDWLSRDLQLVQRGVDEHLDAPRQPRPAPPLRGDYRQ